MGTYAVGDIHGCYDEWIILKEKIEQIDAQAQFILVGDIVDRGPKVFEMLQWATENITEDGKYQMIIGNHELEKLEWIQEYFATKREYEANGNESFELSQMRPDYYDFKRMCMEKMITDEELGQIAAFFDSLPYYKQIYRMKKGRKLRFLLVHGGVPSSCLNQDGSFKKRSIADYANNPVMQRQTDLRKHDLVWYRTNNGTGDRHTWVVHGHTPTISDYCYLEGAVPGKIWINPGNINVDCGMTFREERKLLNGKTRVLQNGNLAAIRLEDFAEFYAIED